MAISPHAAARPRVIIATKDPAVRQAVRQALQLDPSVQVLADGESRPDIVLGEGERFRGSYPCARFLNLEHCADWTLRELIVAVKELPAQSEELFSPERQGIAALSEREREVASLVAAGLTNKQISVRLTLSDKTVKNHISHILGKMHLTARTQIAVAAIRAGLV